MSQLFTTYSFCFRIMSASKSYTASPKKGVNYFAHFPKAFLVPYGKMKDDMLMSKRCLEILNTINCEWLLRPKYAISEMAETFTANTEVVQEAVRDIDFNAIVTKFEEVSELLEIFNMRKNLEKPHRDNVIDIIGHFLTPNLEMENMMQNAEKLGQALYLMANYHRVTQTLFANLEIFAEKSQNLYGLDERFKKDPSMENFTDYLVQSIVGTQVQATDMESRRNLLDAFTRVERKVTKGQFYDTEPQMSTDTDSSQKRRPKRRGKRRESKWLKVAVTLPHLRKRKQCDKKLYVKYHCMTNLRKKAKNCLRLQRKAIKQCIKKNRRKQNHIRVRRRREREKEKQLKPVVTLPHQSKRKKQ